MSFSQNGIVGIGHVLLDGIGAASESFIQRFKDLPSPAHVTAEFMDDFCKALEEDQGPLEAPISWSAGGGIAIMGKAASALGLGVDLWACTGDDARGKLLKSELAHYGVFFHAVASEKSTGIFFVLAADKGGKRIIVSPGAARDIRGFCLPDEAFNPGKILYIDGLLIDSRQWLGKLAEKAKANKMRIALDLSTPGNARRYAAEIAEFSATCCDYVFANEEEFQAILSLSNSGVSSFPRWVVKRGARGAALFHGDLLIEAEALSAEMVDDTGAGDAFAAGFLCGVLEGLDEMSCLKMGNAAGSVAVGTRGSSFDRAALKQAVGFARRITHS